MIFNLTGQHLGDVLLAMPTMRAGDSVIAAEQHRIPGLPVTWLDAGTGALADVAPGRHTTDAWGMATKRQAQRHTLLPAAEKNLTIIAPDVVAASKRWDKWNALRPKLPGAVWVSGRIPRMTWMSLLNRAKTVICPDTGTAHMADALGCPQVVGLYGSRFAEFAPFWSRTHCIVRAGMAAITVDDVLEAVRG